MCRRSGRAGGGGIAIASESKQAPPTRQRALKSYYPLFPLSHPFSAPHTSFECASPWRRPGPCMILVRVWLISGTFKLNTPPPPPTVNKLRQSPFSPRCGKLKPSPDRKTQSTLPFQDFPRLNANQCERHSCDLVRVNFKDRSHVSHHIM